MPSDCSRISAALTLPEVGPARAWTLAYHAQQDNREGRLLMFQVGDLSMDTLLAELPFPPAARRGCMRSFTDPTLYDEAATVGEGFFGTAVAECSTGRGVGHDPRGGGLPVRPDGFSVASTTSPATVSTATSTPARRQGRDPLRKASQATPATITYAELLAEVQRFANVLKGLGVRARRPGQHLPADDPRGRRGDARLRPHRRRRTASSSAGSRPQASG